MKKYTSRVHQSLSPKESKASFWALSSSGVSFDEDMRLKASEEGGYPHSVFIKPDAIQAVSASSCPEHALGQGQNFHDDS